MARVKITEYLAKQVLSPYLGIKFNGFAATTNTTSEQLINHFSKTNLVVKVDQGIKKRGKQGLVKVNVTPADIPDIISVWAKLGWSNFIVEPVIEHDSKVEHYLALEITRDGWQVSYSKLGGIDVESNWDQVISFKYPSSDVPKQLHCFIEKLVPGLVANHVSFLEMNPVLIRDNQLIPLDMACEIDDAGSSLQSIHSHSLSDSEKCVAVLDDSTPASLKFKLLNPDGAIWVFLSGGGASLVIADEVADCGMGKELANYGEYSGSPSDDDVYAYTKIILGQLLLSKSKAPRAIIIAGGVANFTDVEKTFRGLIRALEEQKLDLTKAKVKVFVRRGGPNEEKGLKMMKDFLIESNLLGSVHGHDVPLTQVVAEVKEYLA